MSDGTPTTLLAAIEIAAFQRRADGSFSSVAPPPSWFRRLTADTTFPFLGHILDEANEFWRLREPGRREWGPCAEVDEAGQEFHYKVTAATVADKQYLIFQRDPGSDWIRSVLQKVRAQALVSEQGAAAQPALAAAQTEVRRAANEIRDLLRRFLAASSSGDQEKLGEALAATCDALVNGVDAFVRSAGGAVDKGRR